MKITDAVRLAIFVNNIGNDDRFHPGYRRVLIAIAKSSCGLTSAEIEFVTSYSQGAISTYIRELTVVGLLEHGNKRTGPQNPGLAVVHQLSEKGWTMYDEKPAEKKPTLGEQILQYVAPANHEQVRQLLGRMLEVVEVPAEVRYELAG